MSRPFLSRQRKVLLAAAPILALAGVAKAADGPPNVSDLEQKVAALEAQVKALQAQAPASAPATAPTSTEQVDRALAEVMKDSERRSELLDPTGFTAGYKDGKFIIQSEDGAFRFNPSVGFQFRYVANERRESKNGDAENDDLQNGFEVRRLKFSFNGNAFGEDLTYKFQWNTNRKTGGPELDEGWIRYQLHGTPWALRIGQIPLTWDHESSVPYTQQLAVERSLLHELITSGAGGDDYVQGIQIRYEDPNLPYRAHLMYHDGANSRNTNFQDGGGGLPLLGLTTEHYGVSGRAEWQFAGNWKDHYDFNAFESKTDSLVVGTGFDYEDADNASVFFHTIDVDFKPAAIKGLSLYAAYIGIARDFRNIATTGGVTDSPYDFGFIMQAGYFIDPKWEVFARYDLSILDDHAPTGSGSLGAAARVENHIHEITAGVNYFIYRHNLKLTFDATWLPNGSPVGLDSAGILAQPNNKDQFVFRGQLQLLF